MYVLCVFSLFSLSDYLVVRVLFAEVSDEEDSKDETEYRRGISGNKIREIYTFVK